MAEGLDGFFGRRQRRGAYGVGREDGLVYGLGLLGEGDGGDHGGLDGSDGGGVSSPVAGAVVEIDADGDEGSGDEDVERDRADDAAAELIVGGELWRDGLGAHVLKSLDAKGATLATFREVEQATAKTEADSRRE